MTNFRRTIAAAALLAAYGAVSISPASAQWRGGWGPGPAIGLGIAAGVLAGAAIASQPYSTALATIRPATTRRPAIIRRPPEIRSRTA